MAFSRIQRFFREYLTEEVDDNGRINPKLLAIATAGCRVQSYLGIPDRWRFLPTGNARFQVHQAAAWMLFLTTFACLMLSLEVVMIVLAIDLGIGVAQTLGLCAVCLAMDAVVVGGFWLMVVEERRRAVEFGWEDWKLRQD